MVSRHPSAWAVVAMLLVLVLCSGASIALISSRMQYTGSPEWSFLAWNLALAWLPPASLFADPFARDHDAHPEAVTASRQGPSEACPTGGRLVPVSPRGRRVWQRHCRE